MLLDPPTRRKSLDLLRGVVAVGEVPRHSRIEGVFDSSYSLALVNRQLAMALQAHGDSDVSLATFEQGAEPASGEPWRCAKCYQTRFQTMCFGANEATSFIEGTPNCQHCGTPRNQVRNAMFSFLSRVFQKEPWH